MSINFRRSKSKIPFLLLLIALLPIQIVFGQFGLNNLVNRGKSIFGSIFGQNSPKNEQNKLAKTTTIPFSTISPNSFPTTRASINSNLILNSNEQTNANFGSTMPSLLTSQSPQNNKTFPSFTTTNPFLINGTEINVKNFGQQMMPKNESTGFGNANQPTSPINTSNGFPTTNSPQFGKIFESTFSANLSSIPANSNAPLFTFSTSPSIGFDQNNVSRPNPFNNANTPFNHFGPTNSTPISTPIHQPNSSQFLIPKAENQTNHWNSFDSKLGHNATKMNASNELSQSTMAFTNQSQNGNQFNEFPAPKPFSLEKDNQTNEHSRGENLGNRTNEQTFNGNGTMINAASFPPAIPQFNQTFPITQHPNAISSPAEQQFPSPSALPQQNKFTHFSGNNSANQSNWKTNSPLNNTAAQNSKEHFESNNLTNSAGNLNEKKNEMNNLVQQNGGEEMGNEENKTEFRMNGKNDKIEQELGKQFGNNSFGNGGRMNGTTKIEGEAGKMDANWNQNQQQINEFGNGTSENGKKIEMKKNMTMGSEKGIRNETMEIRKTNENNGTKMVDGIEAKIEWRNKNGSNKLIGRNDKMNGLEENQLNQTISNGQQAMVQNKSADGGQWGTNQQNQNSIGEIPTNQSQSIGFGGPNGTLSSAKGIQQPNGTLKIQQESNQNRMEGQKGNQNNQTFGLENQGNSDEGIGFDPFQTANQTKGQNKSMNAFQPNQTQMQMPNGQNGNILPFTTSTEQTTPPTTPMATTTTQDPIVRKELEKAGAPEVLKQLVPPKAEPIPEPAKQIIEDKCANGKCLEQKPEFKEQRMVVVKQEQAVEQKLNPGKPVEQVQKEVEQRISKTFQLKKELMKSAGLEGKVEPANNGVFQADLLLTEEQASALIAELERQRVQKEGGGGGRKKRAGNAVFMENSASQRWPVNTPIQFMFDQSLAEKDRQAVRQAIAEIQSKTCLKFVEARTKPPGSHLYYTKIANPTFCGLSYVGRIEPANPVYLSFMCGNEAGIGLHETLHALGFQHEQLRFDRDQFITIQWENVNPQQLDFFAISDVTKFSSYGLRYDYGSIMHYSGTIASQNPGKKTMAAKLAPAINDPLMGQRKGLSQSDVEALNKMYCSPGCEDKLVYCGLWATLNLCNPQMWRRAVTHQWIVSNCQKSCNKCGEKLEPVPNRPF